MKHIAVMTTVLLLLCHIALAEQIPSVDHFSPGLSLFISEAKEGKIGSSGTLDITEFAHARDMDVLSGILKMLRWEIFCDNSGNQSRTDLVLWLQEKELFSASVCDGEDHLFVETEGKTWQIDREDFYAALLPDPFSALLKQQDGLGHDNGDTLNKDTADSSQDNHLGKEDTLEYGALLAHASPLERFEMKNVERLLMKGADLPWIGQLQPCTVQETYSDDGQRLTKLDLEGNLVTASGNWKISGFIRRPGGKKPKDTAEIHLVKDEKNNLTLTLSAVYTPEVKRKDREGTVTRNVRIRLDGQRAGYGISAVYSCKATNTWKVEQEDLKERIAVSETVSWQDKTPGRRYMHLNEGKATVRHILTLSTRSDENKGFHDVMSLSLEMDGGTMLAGGADFQLWIPDMLRQMELSECEKIDAKEWKAMLDGTVQKIARALYQAMDPALREKVRKGLPN